MAAAVTSFPCTHSMHIVDSSFAESERYLPLVREVARGIHRRLPKHVDLDDLISAGTVGLLTAAQRFDSASGVEFPAFARCRVRGAMLDLLRQSDWAPRELRRKGRVLQDAAAALQKGSAETPDDAEIAGELGISLKQVRETKQILASIEISSLQEPSKDGETLRIDALEDRMEENALARMLRIESTRHLTDAIDGLPERERLVITLSFYEELTLKEIGEILSLSESRISQLRSHAIRRLRGSLAQTKAAA